MRVQRIGDAAVWFASFGIAASAAAQCQNLRWTGEFSTPQAGLSASFGTGEGCALQVFDPDGPGPEPASLVVGGYFEHAGGVATVGIARWDGRHWHELGAGLGAMGSALPGVTGMGLHDPDGPGPLPPVLIVAGTFTTAGGMTANDVAAWDGAQWSALGAGISTSSSPIQCPVLDFDPDGTGPLPAVLLVARGTIRQWDGTQWTTFPGSPNGVYAMAAYDEDGDGPQPAALFAALDIDPGILRWNASGWSAVGGSLQRSAEHRAASLAVVDEDGPGPGRSVLYVGGLFSLAGGVPVQNIARWDGQQWSSVAGGVPGQVEDIITVDYTNGAGPPTVYAASNFNNGIYRLDPPAAEWRQVGTSDASFGIFTLYRLAAFQDSSGPPSVYFTAPYFEQVNGTPSYAIARYGCACYANCDGSAVTPALNINDFICFQARFAAGEPYANCDNSTTPPVLNVNDFLCFQARFAAGCP